jgi:hypothetical protein
VGLLTNLVTLPVTGPVKAGWWVVEQLIAAAEAELYDEDRIIAEIRALAGDLDAGRITEEEHAAAEEVLLERLMEARAYHAQPGEETW